MQETDHPQEIERTEEEGREAACEFCEIGENCDFTTLRKRPSSRQRSFEPAEIQALFCPRSCGTAHAFPCSEGDSYEIRKEYCVSSHDVSCYVCGVISAASPNRFRSPGYTGRACCRARYW